MKVAIVHDFAYKMGGAERVVEQFLKIYPTADLFMMFGDVKYLSPSFKNREIKYSFLHKFPFIKKYYKWSFFLWPFAIESFNFEGYDLVISHSTVASKAVITDINTKHICYASSIMRYAWDLRELYFGNSGVYVKGVFSKAKKLIISVLISWLRVWDISTAIRADHFIVPSSFVKKRIVKYYKINEEKISVIHPPISCLDEKSSYIKNKKDVPEYYVAISPFEPNKNGELMLKIASKYNFKLKIIGEGSMKKSLMKKYRKFENIQFLGWVAEKKKYEILQGAKAFLFCGIEDFGISAIEAIFCGTPVIAYKAGGALDFVIEGKTGVFFNENKEESLYEAIQKVQKMTWDNNSMRSFADKNFNEKLFREKIISKVKEIEIEDK